MGRLAHITQNKNASISLQYIKKEVSYEIGFPHVATTNWYYVIFDGDVQTFPKFPKYQVCNVFTISPYTSERRSCFFSHADKHQSFLQVYFNNLGIKADSIIIDGHGQALSK